MARRYGGGGAAGLYAVGGGEPTAIRYQKGERRAIFRSRLFCRLARARRSLPVMAARSRSSGRLASNGSSQPAAKAARMPAVPPRTRVTGPRTRQGSRSRHRRRSRADTGSRVDLVVGADHGGGPLGEERDGEGFRQLARVELLDRGQDRHPRALERRYALQ